LITPPRISPHPEKAPVDKLTRKPPQSICPASKVSK